MENNIAGTHEGSADTRTTCEKKTGKKTKGGWDSFAIRSQLVSAEAVRAYDNYLKEHKRRLRQLVRLAAGELTPSSEYYR